jgi:hypothetical protein
VNGSGLNKGKNPAALFPNAIYFCLVPDDVSAAQRQLHHECDFAEKPLSAPIKTSFPL